jgi:hypothetical protein
MRQTPHGSSENPHFWCIVGFATVASACLANALASHYQSTTAQHPHYGTVHICHRHLRISKLVPRKPQYQDPGLAPAWEELWWVAIDQRRQIAGANRAEAAQRKQYASRYISSRFTVGCPSRSAMVLLQMHTPRPMKT